VNDEIDAIHAKNFGFNIISRILSVRVDTIFRPRLTQTIVQPEFYTEETIPSRW
jgi:hypothetical protein